MAIQDRADKVAMGMAEGFELTAGFIGIRFAALGEPYQVWQIRAEQYGFRDRCRRQLYKNDQVLDLTPVFEGVAPLFWEWLILVAPFIRF